jgi:hypothetical protein
MTVLGGIWGVVGGEGKKKIRRGEDGRTLHMYTYGESTMKPTQGYLKE